MNKDELRKRTYQFALRVCNLINALPNNIAGRKVADQLFRSATSVAANYRASCVARSRAEFKSKTHIVLEEVDESEFWLRFTIDAKLLSKQKAEPLRQEAEELTSIFAKTYYTTIKNTK